MSAAVPAAAQAEAVDASVRAYDTCSGLTRVYLCSARVLLNACMWCSFSASHYEY